MEYTKRLKKVDVAIDTTTREKEITKKKKNTAEYIESSVNNRPS